MPKSTATYWKHDENQDDGDDVTMTIYEFLVDYVTDDLVEPLIMRIIKYTAELNRSLINRLPVSQAYGSPPPPPPFGVRGDPYA